jgi:hypothetical protein
VERFNECFQCTLFTPPPLDLSDPCYGILLDTLFLGLQTLFSRLYKAPGVGYLKVLNRCEVEFPNLRMGCHFSCGWRNIWDFVVVLEGKVGGWRIGSESMREVSDTGRQTDE